MQAKEYRDKLAQSFIHVLEEKQLDWKKEWQGNGLRAPQNGKTGHSYHGINNFYLTLVAMERGYEDYRWATYKQIQDKGWKLQDAKGQGVKVEFWFPYDKEEQKNITWDEFRKKGGRLGERFFLKSSYSTVFNGTLIEGISPLPDPELRDISPDNLVETLSTNMNVKIFNDGGERAFYRPGDDTIHLPDPQVFDSDYAYASTALHELAHSTGAKHRLNRDLSGFFGTSSYAFEELIAEISSCFMSANLQVEQNTKHIENHQAYVQNWIAQIKKQPESLVKAVQQAEKTAFYMEYKAELISELDYKKGTQSSVEVSGTNIVETPSISPLKDNLEHMGRILSEVRAEKGYSIEEISEIILLSTEELTSIEAGKASPDSITLQLIGNIYGINTEELQKGKLVPLKSRNELSKVIDEIRTYVEEIKGNTEFLQNFMEKHGIKSKEESVLPDYERQQSKEYYVIEDRETGDMVTDQSGEEIHLQGREEAEKIAALLNREVKNSEDAKVVIRAYEQSIGRTESVIDKNRESTLLNYAAACKQYLRFGQDVEQSMQGAIPNREALLVCQTPDIYVQVGCRPLPMHITQRHLKNCMHKKELSGEQSQKRSKTHYHGMTLQEVKRIPEEIEMPAILGQSLTNENALVSLLGYKDQQGNPVMVSFLPSGKATYELEIVESNFITSVYGRENADNFVKRLVAEDKILYVNENRSKELALSPLYLRQGHHVLASDSIIKRIDADVKTTKMVSNDTNDFSVNESKTKVQKNMEPKI